MYRNILLLVVIFFVTNSSFAQESQIHEAMTSNNKIYVVMAVCIIILIGLFLYLIRIDRKISRKESENS
ncbi:hypothetical protein BH09BAC2_BH09BAC2_22610 [soil metagenome]